MNELIRQFERKSHIDVYALGRDRAQWEATLTRFSDMIVEECMTVVASKCASPTAYQALAKHFDNKDDKWEKFIWPEL
jgi:hypothetical protein